VQAVELAVHVLSAKFFADCSSVNKPALSGHFLSGEPMEQQQTKRGWFDFTISLQWLIGAVISALVGAITGAAIWFGLVGRVQALESRDQDHAAHFARIESDMRQQRADVKEQLTDIGGDVKEIRRYLMDNAAGARPDIRRWAR